MLDKDALPSTNLPFCVAGLVNMSEGDSFIASLLEGTNGCCLMFVLLRRL